jgi:hypothetical protein
VTPGKANRPAAPAALHQQSQQLLDAERGSKRQSNTLQTDAAPVVTKRKKTEKHEGSSTVTTAKGSTGDRTGLVSSKTKERLHKDVSSRSETGPSQGKASVKPRSVSFEDQLMAAERSANCAKRRRTDYRLLQILLL